MKNILSEEELKRYKDLMNYNSKKTQGLLSESKNYLFEAHGKEFITEEDRIRNMHLDAIEEQKKKKRVSKKVDFGPFDVTYTKTPSYSKGYKKTGTVDQADIDYKGLQGGLYQSEYKPGRFYQGFFGKEKQKLFREKSEHDYSLIFGYILNGKSFKKEDLEDQKYYRIFIERPALFEDKTGIKYVPIFKVLKDEKIVTRKLIQSDRFQQQTAIWEEIKEKDPAYAADIITYVKFNDWVERVILKRYDDTEEIQPEDIVKETDPTKTVTDPTKTVEEPTQTEGIPMMGADFGVSGSGNNNIYVDNCYNVDAKTKDKINSEIIQPILDVLANIPETVDNKKLISKMMKGKIKFTWRGCVNSVNFTSSASRFRNSKGTTCDASKLTFLELSRRRAENAKNYIIKELIEKNKMAWCTGKPIINLNYEGSNGDGTSGPNPPLNLGYYIPKGENPMSPAAPPDKTEYTINGKLVKRDECGAPLAKKSDYDKFKYTIINVDAAFNFELMEPETPEVTQPQTKTTPEDKSETPGEEKVEPKVEVKSESQWYSADFYGEEEITEIKRKLRWRWTGFKTKRKKMKGESWIGRKVKTVICNQPQ